MAPKSKVAQASPKSQASKASSKASKVSNDDKANNPDYILNVRTGKHVKKSSAIGSKIVKGETIVAPVSKIEFSIQIIDILKGLCPDVLTDKAIKDAILNAQKDNKIVIPRSFPKKYGGSAKGDKKPKPRSAYNIFVSETNKKVKEENPEFKQKDVMAASAHLWKKLDDDEKAKWNEKAKNEADLFYEQHPEIERKSPKSPKKKNAYNIFYDEAKERLKKENPELGGKEIRSLITKEWKEMDDEEKEAYKPVEEETKRKTGPKSKKGKKEVEKVEEEEVEEEEKPKKSKKSKKSDEPKKRKGAKVSKKVQETQEDEIKEIPEDDEDLIATQE